MSVFDHFSGFACNTCKEKTSGCCGTNLQETHFWVFLFSRLSPDYLSLALLVENLSCGASLFYKQPIFFNLGKEK